MRISGAFYRGLFVLLSAAVLGGCAFGQKITYSDTIADIDATGNKTVAVATLDQRPYVLNGDKKPSFVGLSRGGYGNPFDVETPSGGPLSDEISQSVSRSLAERGFKSSVVEVIPSPSRRAAIEALGKSGAERGVCIALKEWKTDKYFRTSLIQDVNVRVYDHDGNELASASFTSDEVVGDAQTAFRVKMQEWFSNEKIVAALK
jgi:hypothetical protein